MHLEAALRWAFFINVYSGCKSCLSVLETVGIRVTFPNFRDICLFAAGSSRKSFRSVRCGSAASTVCRDVEMFNKHLLFLGIF
jgi:hypothetical protein